MCPSKAIATLVFCLSEATALFSKLYQLPIRSISSATDIVSDVSTEQLSKDVLSDSQSVAQLADRGVTLEHIF